MVKCKICDREFHIVTPSHIKTHGISRTEYIEKYGKKDVLCLDMNISNKDPLNRNKYEQDTLNYVIGRALKAPKRHK